MLSGQTERSASNGAETQVTELYYPVAVPGGYAVEASSDPGHGDFLYDPQCSTLGHRDLEAGIGPAATGGDRSRSPGRPMSSSGSRATPAWITGWGRTDAGAPVVDTLREVSTPIIADADCPTFSPIYAIALPTRRRWCAPVHPPVTVTPATVTAAAR